MADLSSELYGSQQENVSNRGLELSRELYGDIQQEKPVTMTDKLKFALKKAGDFGSVASPLGLVNYVQDKGNEIVNKERNVSGDYVLDKTGSPALATAAYMLPDILNLGVSAKLSSMKQAIPEGNKLAQAANRIGYKPNLAQRTNSHELKNMYDTLRNMPGGSGVIANHEARNANSINSAVANAIGQKANRVTSDVLANATDDLGSVRNSLRSAVEIPKGQQSILGTIDDAYLELKKSLRNTGQFKNDMERIKQGINQGNISGEQYQIWRTDLNDAKDAAYSAGKSQLGKAYKSVLSALDDAARGSASPEWLANDKAFSTLRTVQKGNIINPVTGDVSAPLLTNQFYRDFGNVAKQGKLSGEIQDIATITKGYPMFREGSQTARREAYNSLFPWLMSPVSYTGAKIMTADPANMRNLLLYANPANSAVNGLLNQRQP